MQVSGASGQAPNGKYKTSVGYRGDFLVEGEISYGGSGAHQRAQLADEIVQQRLADFHAPVQDVRLDYIGVNSLYRDTLSQRLPVRLAEPSEVRFRERVQRVQLQSIGE